VRDWGAFEGLRLRLRSGLLAFAGEVEAAARFVLGVLNNEKEPTETRLKAAVNDANLSATNFN
jgi:hypothetical protein